MEPTEDHHNAAESQQLLKSHVSLRATSVRSHRASVFVASDQTVQGSDKNGPQWVPFALHWYFVIFPASLAIICAAGVFALYQHSHYNNGLGPEDSAMFGWKFVPTLIAVIYTQLTSMILSALKRTEPFARLAKPTKHIPVARYTLLEKSKPWWTTLSHAFQKRRNGGTRSWAMIFSCLAYIVAIVGISPMSAALLSAMEVQQSNTETFTRLTTRNDSPLHPQADRATYLRTTGAILQNYSTSPWVTDNFVVLPFWPSNLPYVGSPWDYQISSEGSWEAETTVLRNDFVCTEFPMKNKAYYIHNSTEDLEETPEPNIYFASLLLESDHGCQFNLTFGNPTNFDGASDPQISQYWMSWSDIHYILNGETDVRNYTIRINDHCREDEIILMSSPWWLSAKNEQLLDNMTTQAYTCHTDHTMATIPVRATGTLNGLSVKLDEDLFHELRAPVEPTILNLTEFHDIYTDAVWHHFIPQKGPNTDKQDPLTGPAALLGIGRDFNIAKMMADHELPTVAAKLRRRFFAEIVGASLQREGESEEKLTTGRRFGSARRVLVSGQAASVLCTLLSISFCLLLGTLWLARPTKRKLDLHYDPSTVLGSSLWASGDDTALSRFKTLDLATRQQLKQNFIDQTFLTMSARLEKIGTDNEVHIEPPARTHPFHTAPVLPGLRLRYLLSLLLYIIVLLVGMAVLYSFSRRSKLHQAFFTYRAQIELLGNASTISPFAIVPTVLAIGISLWWESVDNTCRLIQPYISMYHDAEPPSRSIGLSYTSSFWLWASLNALRNRHSLLSLITATTFLIQILTVAMSALFDSGVGTLLHPLTINSTLELRSIPFVQTSTVHTSYLHWKTGLTVNTQFDLNIGRMLEDALYNLKANWMYTAINQIALQGPEPVWSKDDWSFVPLDTTLGNSAFATAYSTNSRNSGSSANLTVQTPAIRARLDCSIIDTSNNISSWLAARDDDSELYLNVTGLDEFYWLRAIMFEGNLTTYATAQGSSPQCCANSTAAKNQEALYSPVAIAYWTENWSSLGGNTGNFTIKWIRGPAGFAEVAEREGLISTFFPEPPAIQALNCMPGFETSKAEVVVDLGSGIVQEYQILSSPIIDDVAWSDASQTRNVSEPPRFRSTDNGTDPNYYALDVTTSYGVAFMKSLLRAACLEKVDNNDPKFFSNPIADDLNDKVFNMRDNITGVNLDFMSYAAYAEVGYDPQALLDPATLLKTSQKVFSTFFRHFVNNNITHKDGGWVYQPVGSHLKVEPPIINMPTQRTPSGAVAPKFESISRNTNQTTAATLSTRVEVLRMNVVAFWISTSILIWLVVTITIFASVQRRKYGGMMRNIECIADVLVLIAGSGRLLAVIKEKGIETIIKEDRVLTRLGWFRDPDGTVRWRCELVEDDQVQMQTIRLGTRYAPVPEEDEGGVGDGVARSVISPRESSRG